MLSFDRAGLTAAQVNDARIRVTKTLQFNNRTAIHAVEALAQEDWLMRAMLYRCPLALATFAAFVLATTSASAAETQQGREAVAAHVGAPVINMQQVRGRALSRAKGSCSATQNASHGVWECVSGSPMTSDCQRGGLHHPERGWCDSAFVLVLHQPSSPNHMRAWLCEARSAYFVRWVSRRARTVSWHKWTTWYTKFSCARMSDG